MPLRPASIVLLLLFIQPLQSQTTAQGDGTRVEILSADEWSFDELVPGAQRLKGSVRFRHAGAVMRCDSAHLFDDQRVDAFGNVRIEQGDTLRIDSERLRYSGRDRTARLEGGTRLRDRDMELITPSLDYDLRQRQAVYAEGGRIMQRDGSVLTSERGTYLARAQRFIFSRNVRLDHPERTIDCDTMHYAVATGIAEFFGPTTIRQEGTLIRTLRGTYDTRNEKARFTKRSSILSKGRTLEGDSLHYDRRTGIGLAWGNVAASDTAGDLTVRGEHGRHHEPDERSLVTGRAEMALRMGDDTLHLHADTLFTAPDNGGRGMRVLARRGVRFFKQDLQGVCDTLTYSEADSLVRMFHEPVLWSGSDQITGGHIAIALRDGKAHTLHVEGDAFLISRVDSLPAAPLPDGQEGSQDPEPSEAVRADARYDQVTGTTMTGWFEDNELRSLLAEGNCRTVYFARETKDGVEELIGVNRADCSRIRVTLADGAVRTVTFLDRPDAVLYPMDQVPPEELRMKGAHWRGEERPVGREDIFRRP